MPSDASAGAGGALELRRFAPADAHAVRKLHDLARREDRAGSGPARRAEDLDSIPATYIDDGGEFLVGVCDDRVVAIGALRHITDTVVEIMRVNVHPAFQRRGFAGLLLAGLEARARELGYQELRLDTAITQTAAQRLFNGAGFRDVGRGQFAGVEVVYFAKSLP